LAGRGKKESARNNKVYRWWRHKRENIEALKPAHCMQIFLLARDGLWWIVLILISLPVSTMITTKPYIKVHCCYDLVHKPLLWWKLQSWYYLNF
jgi:hypothetical protein